MKYFNSSKAVISSSISTALTLLCFVLYFLDKTQGQYLTVGIILVSFSASSWLGATVDKESENSKVISIANIVLDVGCFLCIALYGFFRTNIFLYASLGFAGALAFVFIAVLISKMRK